MKKVGIFYGSDSGNTQTICEKIADKLGKENTELIDVAKASKDQLLGFDNLILASSTYGSGDLQTDWEDFIGSLDEADFSGKTVALVGLGDQDTYSDTFCDALYHLYDKAKGGKLIGQTSTDGYTFDDSKGVDGGKFVGLAIDEDNQDDMTDSRIDAWVSQIKSNFA
ncbi:flavodoxin [Helicobacter sp. 13S00482-2]|uniref:flavodoxin n=1 Tax=Helicobacter sp. 13S00482-2 TaxID=1476200 RepID=UPI000BA6CF03|nr:flavodoxin [Helicobacter sp. 13S00482-2]PAF53419.1 flavodoxin [Helicobacter sp. 13S00482-2]